jgi:transcriptional regulator NrdR family protein
MRFCPECSEKLMTTQTRQATQDEMWTRRRKVCVCGFRTTTYEMPASDLGFGKGIENDTGSESQEESSDDS